MINKFWRFQFEDGMVVVCRGFSKSELNREIKEHGKLISKTPA